LASQTAGDQLDAYRVALEEDETPLLGYLALYSIPDTMVLPDDLAEWLLDLDLDFELMPSPARPIEAFERITGPKGVRLVYPLDPEQVESTDGKSRRREPVRQVTLMLRPVRRDDDGLVRHLVREVRDGNAKALDYQPRIADCIFIRDQAPDAEKGAGELEVEVNHTAMRKLSEMEQGQVHLFLEQVIEQCVLACTHITGDRLRTMIRKYVERLDGIKVLGSGGTYFVQASHRRTLSALRELVGRFPGEGAFYWVPLSDQEQMRAMITAAVNSKAADDLRRLSADIAAAREKGPVDTATLRALFERFTRLREQTDGHSQLLRTSLIENDAAFNVVYDQITRLVAESQH
jgi:hypothetical protein